VRARYVTWAHAQESGEASESASSELTKGEFSGGRTLRPAVGGADEGADSRQQGSGAGGDGGRGGRRMPFLLAGGLTGFGLMQVWW
jgi:hypothetical protein